MKRHAYLIMAHSDWSLFSKLLKTLDDPRNDLYIHIDAKANFQADAVYKPKQAGCYYIPRMNVSWGGDNQIKCELALLQEAAKKGYFYYHLISGVDLPLKSQEYIHRFFQENEGKNYIEIDHVAMSQGISHERIQEYHFLQNKIGRNSGRIVAVLYHLEKMSLAVQRRMGVDRLRHCPKTIYKGTNWFSIDHAMAETVLSQLPFIQKYCFRGIAADEIFLQTVAMSSELRDTIVDDDLRYIDWHRGKPYTFTIEDYGMLMNSNKLFARKFSDQIDSKLTTQIMNEVTNHDR